MDVGCDISSRKDQALQQQQLREAATTAQAELAAEVGGCWVVGGWVGGCVDE
jgi:hypothetical protein